MKLPPYVRFEDLPGIGPSIASDLRRLGLRDVGQMKTASPEQLYADLEALDGRTDRCMLYVFRCAHYALNAVTPDESLLQWWRWSDRQDKSSRFAP
jgi:nucleotidyltransferase/DNA polymerase involved in DNA repair